MRWVSRPFLLSLTATSASLPFFLFALPAGIVSDLVNRKKLLIACYLCWPQQQGFSRSPSGCTRFNHIESSVRLFCSVSALPLVVPSGRQSFPRSFGKVNSLQRSF